MAVDTLDVKQVSDMLNVTPGTVYRWAKEGELPSMKLGRTLRFSRKIVEGKLGDIADTEDEEAPEDDRVVVVAQSGSESADITDLERAAILWTRELVKALK